MDLRVADVMTRDVVTAGEGDDAATLAGIMTRHRISALPVCDQQDRLVGIVSEGDLLRPFGRRHNLRRDWWLGVLSEGEELAPAFLDYVRDDHRPARDLMTRAVYTAVETMPLGEATDLILQHGIKRLLVLRDGRVVGIVSRADILKSLLPAARATVPQPVGG